MRVALPNDARRALLQTSCAALATTDEGIALGKRCTVKLLARLQGQASQATPSETLHTRCPTFHDVFDALKTDVCFLIFFFS